MKRHEYIRRILAASGQNGVPDIHWLYERATELAFALRCLLHDHLKYPEDACASCRLMAQTLLTRWDADADQPTLPQLDVCPNGASPTSESVCRPDFGDWLV